MRATKNRMFIVFPLMLCLSVSVFTGCGRKNNIITEKQLIAKMKEQNTEQKETGDLTKYVSDILDVNISDLIISERGYVYRDEEKADEARIRLAIKDKDYESLIRILDLAATEIQNKDEYPYPDPEASDLGKELFNANVDKVYTKSFQNAEDESTVNIFVGEENDGYRFVYVFTQNLKNAEKS